MKKISAICLIMAAAVTGMPSGYALAAWTPFDCGKEPSAPSLDVSTVENYNSSVDKVAAYEKAARAYNSCVAKAAAKEETAISNEAKAKMEPYQEGSAAVQKRIAGNFTKYNTELKAAAAKFSKKK